MATNDFSKFAKLVAANFQSLTKTTNVFVVNLDGEALYAKYLAAFPEGTNPVFKKNTEHDCGCCKGFIRRVGNVVAVEDGKIRTVWDKAAEKAPGPYHTVAATLCDAVLAAPISDLFRVNTKEGSFGAIETRSLDKETQRALTWEHFYTGTIADNLRVASPDAVKGDYRTTVQVFERGLVELSPNAVDTVLALIEANNLYRGEEHKNAVQQFQKAQQAFLKMQVCERAIFLWTHAHGPASRFRNTVIGTLVQDLSEGQEVERAVQSFEGKVAPQNYKRTTAIITPGMVKKAMETIEALGLEPALERRFATIGDISVNDVKWVDGAVKPLMKGGIGDTLMQHAVAATTKNAEEDEKRAERIALDAFLAQVLPETTGMELLFKGDYIGNLMTLTAPIHPEPKQLFRWNNDFAWSYGGNVADSIKERVKKAGGKVEGALLRVSLSWFNTDDLDLHIWEPTGRGTKSLYDHIWFGGKRGGSGGTLDVDMNAGNPVRDAVENVVWAKMMPDGPYKVVVNNYNKRETGDPRLRHRGGEWRQVLALHLQQGRVQSADILVAVLHLKNGAIERIEMGDPAITASNISQEKWGLKTEQYVKVAAVTLSPNYWGDNAVGNKHTFFVIDGCKSDEPMRGIYNEFLHPRLEPHRKVFEVIGDKTKCQPIEGAAFGAGLLVHEEGVLPRQGPPGQEAAVVQRHGWLGVSHA